MKIHSYLSPKCVIRKSKIHELGVFAAGLFRKGEVITIWGGSIYSTEEIDQLSEKFPHFRSHPFGVFPGYYMGPSHPEDPIDDSERFNHSCSPNAGIKGQIILVARRDIFPSEEIFFDYETVETSEDGLGFTCKCCSKKCRHLIDGSAWKNAEYLENNKDYLSWYVTELVNESTTVIKGQ